MKWKLLNRHYSDSVDMFIRYLTVERGFVRSSLYVRSDGIFYFEGYFRELGISYLLDWILYEGFYLQVENEVVGSKILFRYSFRYFYGGVLYETNWKDGGGSYGEIFDRAVKDVIVVLQKRKIKRTRKKKKR